MPPKPHTHSKSHVEPTVSITSSSATLTPSSIGKTLQITAHKAATMPSMISSVSVVTLSQTDLEKIEVLDRSKNTWGTWSNKIQNYLLLKHGGGYLLGIIQRPDPLVDPTGTGTWDLNNLCIIAALRTCSTQEEGEFLRTFTNTYTA